MVVFSTGADLDLADLLEALGVLGVLGGTPSRGMLGKFGWGSGSKWELGGPLSDGWEL